MESTIQRTNRSRAIGGGALAGIFGGIVISVYMIGMALADGRDIWPILKGAGTPFIGDAAQQPGFDLVPVLVGVAVHFGVSIIWGVLFAILFFGASKLGTLALGVLWGVVVWAVMYYVVLPLAGMGEVAGSQPLGQAVFEHVIFGLAIAIAFLPYQKLRGDRRPEAPVRPAAAR